MDNFKNKFYAIFAVLSCMLLIIFSQDCMNAAITGFNMWLCFVMPSVFPFFVFVSFMRESGILSVGKCSMLPLFISCAMSSAPSGSRLCSHLSETGYIRKEGLSGMSAACNMVSPVFITGTLVGMTGQMSLVLPILIGHYGASLIVLLFSKRYVLNTISFPETKPDKKFFDILNEAIIAGVRTVVQICGVIIFFTVALTLIIKLASLLHINTLNPIFLFLLSLIEMTNGVNMLCMVGFSYPVMCGMLTFMISFGGICIMVQAIQVARINPKEYLKVKLLVAIIGGAMAYILARIIPNTSPVFSNAAESLGELVSGSMSLGLITLSSLIGCGCVWLLGIAGRKRSQ